ncbi:alpha/beta hydrolase [Jiulongibacter sp. NS-SX5]|uniref:alpha/beta hydrolase n=1 Tax=Jiulongibacter sp. NS-SX5 TaxID=3463854 RepID=UPI0040580810
MKHRLLLWRKPFQTAFLILGLFDSSFAQQIIPLYAGEVINSKQHSVKETGQNNGVLRGVTVPTLEVFRPENQKENAAAVLVIPGGGYSVVVYQGEGIQIAKALNEQGLVACVLKYRLPSDETMIDKKYGPVQDAQQALKIMRENAEAWGLNNSKIGVMGFSAGGHLASTLATHYDTSFIENKNKISLRPDFQILVYPVISFKEELTHSGSKNKLLGERPSAADVLFFSNEEQIKPDAPMAYLTHTADDNVVDVNNSIEYFQKLRLQNTPVEMHIYPEGNHGFIFKHPGWMTPLFDWMKRAEIINNH